MPQAELKYTDDLEIDAARLLAEVERVILTHDSGAGDCKGRAWPLADYHHSHAILEVSLLPKAHRDTGFMNALSADIAALLADQLPKGTWASTELRFSGAHYTTAKTG